MRTDQEPAAGREWGGCRGCLLSAAAVFIPGIPVLATLGPGTWTRADIQDWQRIMPRCLAVTCVSAPDVAYAVEYGRHFCARAGVPDVKFEMPERFLLSEGGAYYK